MKGEGWVEHIYIYVFDLVHPREYLKIKRNFGKNEILMRNPKLSQKNLFNQVVHRFSTKRIIWIYMLTTQKNVYAVSKV